MTTPRTIYTYELIGAIQKPKKRKNKKHTQYFYQLNINCENFSQITKIFAFKDKLINPSIWEALQTSLVLTKRYLFYCRNYFGSYYLINWKELQK